MNDNTKLKVRVTASDILLAQANPKFCPIERATARAAGVPLSSVRAGRGTIMAFGKHYHTPLGAQTFITRFDGRDSVEPFEFEAHSAVMGRL